MFGHLSIGGMSVKDYARMFTRLSRYVPSIVGDPRMNMSKFVSGVSNLIAKECSMVMLRIDMDIDCLVIHARCFEREKLEERSRGTKRYRLGDGNSSQGRLNRPKFYGQSFSKVYPRLKQKRVSNAKSQANDGRTLLDHFEFLVDWKV